MGIGLLSASGPSATPVSLGQALGQGVQFASQQRQLAARNRLMRSQLEDTSRRRAASQQLANVINEELAQEGGNPGRSRALSALAQLDPAAALKMVTERPRGLAGRFQALRSQLGRPLTEKESLRIAGGSHTNINVGDQLNSPIPVGQIGNIRLPNGQPVPIGTTFGEARSAGARVTASQERDRADQVDSALTVFNELEQGGYYANGGGIPQVCGNHKCCGRPNTRGSPSLNNQLSLCHRVRAYGDDRRPLPACRHD